MTIIFVPLIIFLILVFIVVATFLFFQTKKEKNEAFINLVNKVLEEKGICAKEIIYVNPIIAVAINKKNTKLSVIVKNFSSDNYAYEEINSHFITSIEKNKNHINITYVSTGTKKLLSLNRSDKLENAIYELYKNAYVSRLAQKYEIRNFALSSGSDWNCTYVWAYNHIKSVFAYYKTTEKIAFHKLNILKEFFTIDTRYNYILAPIMGIPQQLSVYEKNFLDEFYNALFKAIKSRASSIVNEKLYFDSHNNVAYLSNGLNMLQSIVLDKIKEVYYYENKLIFSMKDESREISFFADRKLIEEFGDFVTTYNLREIADNFDYSTDKLINATENTKFIVDYTRNRVIYCASLNKFSQFSYMTVAFNNLESAKVEKSGGNYFVRIHTKNKEIIDISCNKSQVAQYILAQITVIING